MPSASAPLYPQLRPLDFRPHQHQGQQFLLVRDPSQLTEQTLLIPQPLAMVLAYCDGTRDVPALAAAFQQDYGIAVPLEMVEELLTAMDEALFLENERTAQARQAALAAYRQAACRPAMLAGLSYPAESGELWRLFQDYLEACETIEPRPVDWSRPVGLLSPHIDYGRGGPVYAQIWKRAAEAARSADLVVILGTDHYGEDAFTLTRQHYATPYGTLPTALPLVDTLAEIIGEAAAFAGELRHRREHSLELVALWLHHMRGGEPVEVVPILVGGLHRYLKPGLQPTHDPLFARVLTSLREQTQGRRLLVVASGDLAHVGPAFGGAPLNAAGKARIQAADAELLNHLGRGDAAGFFAAIQRVGDRNNVCGVAPLYLTLRLLGAVQGEAIGYAVCPADEQNQSIVTIGGMFFH